MESFPDCFETSEEFESWVTLAQEDPEIEEPRLSFCTDCLPWFQNLMKKQGRCVNPTFVPKLEIDDNGD